MTNQNDMDFGAPEDAGQGLFDQANIVRELLAPPDSLEHSLINARLARPDAFAMIEMYQTGLQFRQPHVIQEIALKITATTGEDGQGRVEAHSAVMGRANVQAYDLIDKKTSLWSRFRKNKKPDNLDE